MTYRVSGRLRPAQIDAGRANRARSMPTHAPAMREPCRAIRVAFITKGNDDESRHCGR